MLKNSMFMIISDRRRFSVKNPGGFCDTGPNVESTNIHALSPEKAANESKIPVTEQPYSVSVTGIPVKRAMKNRHYDSQGADTEQMVYSSRSPSKISCQGRPCLFSSSIKGSGLNSSTFQTPGFFHRPNINMRAPMQAGTPVV